MRVPAQTLPRIPLQCCRMSRHLYGVTHGVLQRISLDGLFGSGTLMHPCTSLCKSGNYLHSMRAFVVTFLQVCPQEDHTTVELRI